MITLVIKSNASFCHDDATLCHVKAYREPNRKVAFDLLEAAAGLEPAKNGFADRCLIFLAMPPCHYYRPVAIFS